ncbi:hypothetical protein [Streptomyces viridochromogenes]|uniref:Uncharacterized protein n=1 Tax=Streptomyces viridochromogenes Tue57 TaxID=1160705 RepID=L8PJH9_STRVR|nr:hypothetical protein [Streptomyces viridochromogenes]ELS57681.1 hypothetical protein STVIR_1419 [Streptomyces viridochromogenes Tue57]
MSVSRTYETGDPGVPNEYGGYQYWFDNEDLSVDLYVEEPAPDDGFFGQVPAMLMARSRSETQNWEMAEKLYARLARLGRYRLVAFADSGMPIDANFDIGDDW